MYFEIRINILGNEAVVCYNVVLILGIVFKAVSYRGLIRSIGTRVIWDRYQSPSLNKKMKQSLIVLAFNVTLTAKVTSWRSVAHMCFHTSTNFSLKSHRLFFSHTSAEMRGKNTPERKFASTGDRNHNHQAKSPTRSLLSYPGGVCTYSISS